MRESNSQHLLYLVQCGYIVRQQHYLEQVVSQNSEVSSRNDNSQLNSVKHT